MKIRAGFVSNSSSTSFVVSFPAGFVATPATVQAYLFPTPARAAGWPTQAIARAVCTQMAYDAKYHTARIRMALGGFAGAPRFDWDHRHPERNKTSLEAAIAAWEPLYDAAAQAYLVARFGPGHDFYGFTFWDNVDDAAHEAIADRWRFAGVPHTRPLAGH
jgi:hypothetical protein